MSIISIVVPVYKVEEYLSRCIDSILEQTFQNFELILVDDGSPDLCGEICEKYAEKDKRVIVLHRENGGLSAARNTGVDWIFSNSSSKYVTFVDSDDWIHPQFLEILLHAILNYNAGVSVCRFERVNEYRTCNMHLLNSCPKVEVMCAEDFLCNHEWDFNYSCGKLYRREYFEKIRYPQGRKYEDTFTTYKILFAASSVAYVEEALYYYFYNPKGISHSSWNPSELDIMEGMKKQIKFYKEHDYQKALEKEKYLYVNHHAYQICRIRDNNADRKRNMPYLRKLRKEMFRLIRQNPEKYGYRKMPQCYEAAYPRLMRIYHGVGKFMRKLIRN